MKTLLNESQKAIVLSLLLICSVAAFSNQSNAAGNKLSDEEKIYGLSILWKEASYNFAYFDQVPDIDWDKTYQAYIAKVIATESIVEYYDVLKQFLALLKDGHTRIIPPEEYKKYFDEPKIKLINIKNTAIVKDVGESLKKRIAIGSRIIKVNDISTDDYLKNEKFPYISCTPEHMLWTVGILELLKGERGTNVKITYSTPKGQTKEITLKRNSKEANEKWIVSDNDEKGRLNYRELDNGIGYLALNTYSDEKIKDDFKQILPKIQKCRGIIIDIRKDMGGDSEIGYSILRHFIEKPIVTETWKSREHVSVYKAWGKWTSELPSHALENVSKERKEYLRHYNGTAWYHNTPVTIDPANDDKINIPTVVLAGNMTASAAEDFLIGSNSIKDVVTIGQRTAGFPGIPLFIELPGGGFGLITTTKETSVNGNDIRYGIKPDIEIQPTVQDIIENKDPVLEKAIEILNNKIK